MMRVWGHRGREDMPSTKRIGEIFQRMEEGVWSDREMPLGEGSSEFDDHVLV
jgi:hypothetical protein